MLELFGMSHQGKNNLFKDAVDMESIWSALRKTLYRNHKSTPSMVLSVIGDSDSLVPRHWAKNVFQTALIEAAKSGGGKVFLNGTHTKHK